ncbi:MAG: DUF2341 domain-containing protein [Chitinispirillaceae bacterium]|nr:DUF2341 domain-containing protein [Chitinispirillaceae bacterium]
MNRSALILAALVTACLTALLFISNCSPQRVSGGGTEGGNTVCGVFINDDKSASVNTQVYLLPSDFNPFIDNLSTIASAATTDDSGYYTFNNTGEGEYTIQAMDLKSNKRTLITGIRVAGEDIEVPIDTLREPGAMLIALPGKINDNSAGYLYIPGTTIYAPFTDTSIFVFVKDVPARHLPPLCRAKQSDPAPDILRYDVEVTPNDTVVVKNTHWKYARHLYLNTTASGANVSGNVTNFPAVIRLTRSNFDFFQTKNNGSDLRFFRTDSILLAYEIERWDIISGQAEIWVRVDSIYGNNSTQCITMYWGNPDAAEVPENVVFDTAAGFQGVWHLDETTDTVHDATPNHFHGLRIGPARSSPGIIGIGQRFDDSGAFIDMGNVLNTGNSDLTLSAWVKRSTTGLQTIMAKSSGGNPNADYGWTLSFQTTDQLHFFAASAGTSWGADGAFDCWSKEESPFGDTTAWHFVAAVFDRSDKSVCRLYIDGVEVTGGANGNISGVIALTNEVSLRIGAESDGDYKWTGLIDECVIAHTVRDQSWIRLCYSNQGKNDLLIHYK